MRKKTGGNSEKLRLMVDPHVGPEVATINCTKAARKPSKMRRAKHSFD